MTKLINALFLFCTVAFASAQISVAGKAHLLFPAGSPSWKNIKNTAVDALDNKGKNNTGFNIGLSLKIDTPTSFFVMPEIYYTTFKNETDVLIDGQTTTLEAKSNRVDVPVLLGYNLLGEMLGIYAGPVLSYNLSKDNTFQDFRENATKNFTVGYQFGAQATISKIIISARYEGAFSKDERSFITNNLSDEIRYDNRTSLFMVGLGYKF